MVQIQVWAVGDDQGLLAMKLAPAGRHAAQEHPALGEAIDINQPHRYTRRIIDLCPGGDACVAYYLPTAEYFRSNRWP